MGPKGGHQIARTIALGELPKDHAGQLVPASKMLAIFVSPKPSYNAIEYSPGKKIMSMARKQTCPGS